MSTKRIDGMTYSETNVIVTDTQDLLTDSWETLSIQLTYADVTPEAVDVPSEDIDPDEDTFTLEDHGLSTGIKGQWTTDDVLPDGLTAMTNYWVIVLDADTFQVAASLQDALDGTPVDLVDEGSGTQTFTPTALAGSITLKASNNGEDWVTLASPSAVTVTTDGTTVWADLDVSPRYLRVNFAMTAGAMDLDIKVNAKADAE